MAAPGVTLVQQFTYRGAPEEWSNTYHFQGDAPDNDADWETLIDGLTDIIAPAITSVNYIVRAYGYENTDNDASFVYDIAGTGSGIQGTATVLGTGSSECPGDVAAWIRWKTSYLNSKGKPVYLRKYYHGVWSMSGGEHGDTLDTILASHMQDAADALQVTGGDWPGIADPSGNAAGVNAVSQYVTTRTRSPPSLSPSEDSGLYAWYWQNPVGGEYTFIGIYGHTPPSGVGLSYRQVKNTWTNEAIHFASSYAAKSALWLKNILP